MTEGQLRFGGSSRGSSYREITAVGLFLQRKHLTSAKYETIDAKEPRATAEPELCPVRGHLRSLGPEERSEAKEEQLKRGTEVEDVTKAPELPTAKEELLQPGMALPDERGEAKEVLIQQGPALPDERNKAKEELLPQGTWTEDGTSNHQPHLNTARTPTPPITWEGL